MKAIFVCKERDFAEVTHFSSCVLAMVVWGQPYAHMHLQNVTVITMRTARQETFELGLSTRGIAESRSFPLTLPEQRPKRLPTMRTRWSSAPYGGPICYSSFTKWWSIDGCTRGMPESDCLLINEGKDAFVAASSSQPGYT